jgi:hypothetical protein
VGAKRVRRRFIKDATDTTIWNYQF